VEIDLDRINMSGMTALHQAVLDDNLVMVRLLIQHGAKINKKDEDGWTPLHAAAANGLHHIARYLIAQGADKDALTEEDEKAVDLVDQEDYKTISVLLNTQESVEKERRMSAVPGGAVAKREPAWFRRESLQTQRESLMESGYIRSKLCADERKIGVRLSASKINDKDSFSSLRARKGSLWVGTEPKDVVKEEEEEERGETQTTTTPTATPPKSIIKVEKMREKFEVLKTSSSSSAHGSNQQQNIETEESVSSKLEQWKRRRIERLER